MMNKQRRISTHGSKRRMLVVEDNAINREMLAAVLSDDFDVIEAEDGEVGLALLSEGYQDLSLILLDVMMPRCDGFEFLRRMRADERYDSVPVIVATASDSVDDEIECLKLGANDFIMKPYNFEVMLNRINNMVRLRESASIVNKLTWDATTGLYSKDFFLQAARNALEDEPEADFSLVCSDVDNFKSLNDRYGEPACDRLLHDLAANIGELLPGLVAGGRIGADKFAYLIHAQDIAWDELLQDASKKLAIPHIGVKFGVVERVDRRIETPKLCNRALSAIDTLDGVHGIAIAVFNEELHQRQELEQTIRESMESALGGLQFSVYYQPKHDVRSGHIGGAEALVRWISPEIGFISPGLFIPIFERNGFITTLDLFVWEQACKEICRCRELGLPEIPISVNASRLDFDLPDLPQRIADLADRYGVDRRLLHVELTETAYSDNPENVTRMLQELKELGFETELDDFGAGYSSLVSLNTLPLDVMKLDMSMVRQATALNDFRIVESTIKLAQTLGLRTVVEGVETAEEARRVGEMGADLIQGYFYSKPLTQDDFETYLRSEQ